MMVCVVITVMFCLVLVCVRPVLLFFFFNDPATTDIYTLSLHDALPISRPRHQVLRRREAAHVDANFRNEHGGRRQDRKSTRLNSSHQIISYAVFCLKKKKKNQPASYTTQYPAH